MFVDKFMESIKSEEESGKLTCKRPLDKTGPILQLAYVYIRELLYSCQLNNEYLVTKSGYHHITHCLITMVTVAIVTHTCTSWYGALSNVGLLVGIF